MYIYPGVPRWSSDKAITVLTDGFNCLWFDLYSYISEESNHELNDFYKENKMNV